MRKHLNQGKIVIHPFIIAELAWDRFEVAPRLLHCWTFCHKCEWRV
jgi:hypothetical protein